MILIPHSPHFRSATTAGTTARVAKHSSLADSSTKGCVSKLESSTHSLVEVQELLTVRQCLVPTLRPRLS